MYYLASHNLTISERERLAYAVGDTDIASLLATLTDICKANELAQKAINDYRINVEKVNAA
jgi:hypothetical protein